MADDLVRLARTQRSAPNASTANNAMAAIAAIQSPSFHVPIGLNPTLYSPTDDVATLRPRLTV